MAQALSFADARRLAFTVALGLATLFVAQGAHVADATAQDARSAQTRNQQARPQAAAQGWQICNQTSYIVEAAHARPDGRSTLVQGWLRLRPGECRVAAPAPLARGVHFLFARTSTAHRGGRRQWGGAGSLCVDPTNNFAIENPPRCATMGLEERQFREVRINRREVWRTILSEAEPYSQSRARAAGLQRLLLDAGVDARGAGGDPRRLAAALQKFRQDARLSQSATQDQLVDALEAAARRRAEGIGLTLCNRAQEPVWAAIARRRGEGWESRGWWPIAPGGCARTIDDPLVQSVYFIHAVMTGKQGERYLAAGGEVFCTAATRFAILGREQCEERLYDSAVFAAIAPKEREGMVVEFFEREFLPPGVKPRRVEVRQMASEDAKAPAGDGGQAPKRGLAPLGATGQTQ